MLSVLHQTGATTLDGAGYTYDAAGNRTSKTNYQNNVTEGYTYDPLYELTHVTQGASTTESYSYDPVGNRLSSLATPFYNYNASNELTSHSLGSYTYDNNGNTISDASGKSYSWDFENRLTRVVVAGSGTVAFQYDPFGRRIQKSSPSGTTNYFYEGDNHILERDNSGNILAKYAQDTGTDEHISESRSGSASYYEQDALGSVTSLSNASASVTNTYTYDSFGNTTASTGTLNNPFRFTGREFDLETGIYQYRMRYYDPNVGRFISEDPIDFRGGSNFYAYARNNPVRWTDPFGLEVLECRRPLNVPGVSTPHTFLYSTDSGIGPGLGPKNDWWAAWATESGRAVPGTIEEDYPYDPSGKTKPHYECQKISDDQCFEACVNEKASDAMSNPPKWQMGTYQCDTWVNDIERQCRQQCKKR